jgi:succinate dehydrogenase hydrophobic anchor subunit
MSWHQKNPLQGSLARVRGLGSAHEGAGHWWSQRVSAVALTFFKYLVCLFSKSSSFIC